ncbi:MAG: hypothetical protein CMM91_06515 [Rickettsiales bacterium]|jgi:hypothetical protein|nr:hypothetical protein [Rickettsiales bacterium]|tara:strand:- start:1192 stop:1548 length:357 start_codon:yes stop_codon:yes gene_type:complete
MGFLAITPSVNGTTGEVTYTSAVPANGVKITGVVLREFMTNGPTKNSNGTYNTTVGDLVYDVKVRPNSVTATMTVTKGSAVHTIIMFKTPEGIQQEYKFATGDTIKVNGVVEALITDA